MIGTKVKILLFFVVASGILMLCRLGLRYSMPKDLVAKAYERDVAEGVRVWNPKEGVDIIRFESCRVEKMKSGPITFGGFDVLCIRGLVVNLPFPDDADSQDGLGSDAHVDAFDGIPRSLLRGAALPYEGVAGLCVNGLSVNRIENRSVVPVFAADELRNRGRSLVLTNCRVFDENGRTNFVRRATLKMQPSPVLAWTGGERRLDDLFPNNKEKMK